ncbi:hypothetical protein ACHAWO_010489 [Cyclotella atomus]|uniref:SNF2 N-terminal domain-containing protein n=1 Tax=Cyclotella atomus TaxID=382360 RepID=A0ABD3Q6Q2_9STRA
MRSLYLRVDPVATSTSVQVVLPFNPKFPFKQKLLLSGTPIQNDPSEIWLLLNFIDPKSFSSLSAFQEQFGDLKEKEQVEGLHEIMRPYFCAGVPPKEETLIEVEPTPLQKQYYRALYKNMNLKFLHPNGKKTANCPCLNNLAIQLRKCCNHPFMLNGVQEVSSQNLHVDCTDSLVNAVLLGKLLPRFKADGHRVLLFSQFKNMLDIIQEYFSLRGFNFERIDGNISGQKQQAAIDRFQSKKEAGNDTEPPLIMLISHEQEVSVST